MKNVLVIGECCVDFASYVNEDANALEENSNFIERIAGSGYEIASVFKGLNMPYHLFTGIGEGVYADKVREQLKSFQYFGENSLTAGCTYTMIDVYGNTNSMNVGQGQFELDFSSVKESCLSDVSYVIVTDDMFTKDNSDDLIAFLEKYKGRIIFKLTLPFLQDRFSFYQKISSLCAYIHISEVSLCTLLNKDDISEQDLHDLMRKFQCPLIITLYDGGSYYVDMEGNFLINDELESVNDLSGYEMAHIGAIGVCLNVGLPIEKAIKFACIYAKQIVTCSDVILSEEQNKLMQKQLGEIILEE